MSAPSPTEIEAVRRFSRFYTRRSELLDEHLLRSRFSLTEGRLLYEIARREEIHAATLSRELGMDPGYLSRVLGRFEAEGLLARAPSAADGRQRSLALTPAGRAAFRPLDAGARDQVAGWLAPLSARERIRLADAMATVEGLLGRAEPPDGEAVEVPDATAEVVLRDLEVGDVGAVIRGQALLYAREYGWDATYEALVAEILAGFVRGFDPARERAWIAASGADILGSVFLVRACDEVAKLRLLYVEPAARGLGLGGRLVEACIAGARAFGYRRLTLWTNDCLVSARRIYQAAGFRLIAEARHHSFGHDLVGQTWDLDL